MASIYRRVGKKGVVTYQVKYKGPPDASGKRLMRSKTFRLKKDASRFKAEAESDQYQGVYVADSKMPCSELFEEVLDVLRSSDFSPVTVVGYKSIIDNHLRPAFGAVKLSDVTRRSLNAFVQTLSSKDLSPVTVRNVLGKFLAILHRAVDWEYISVNPAQRLVLPKLKPREYTVLDEFQAKALITAAEGTVFYLLMLLALHTGFRMGELLGLQFDCVDWERNELRVERSMKSVTGHRNFLGEPKHGSRRTVWVEDVVMEALRVRKLLLEEEWKRRGLVDPPRQVLAFLDGRIMLSEAARTGFKKLLAVSGNVDMRMHDMRHTNSTLLLRDRCPVHTVSKRLGHKDVATTMRTYAHAIQGDDKELGQAIGRILS